jgi:hypothetical protein
LLETNHTIHKMQEHSMTMFRFQFLWLIFHLVGTTTAFVIHPASRRRCHPTTVRYEATLEDNHNSNGGDDDPLLPLWKLASAHCASQALNTALRLGIIESLGDTAGGLTLEEIADTIGPTTQRDALLRTLRLLTTVDILDEEQLVAPNGDIRFSLTPTGELLRSSESGMGAGVQHWMERPLWSAWLELPDYIREGGGGDGKSNEALPFDRANGGVSSDFYYNAKDHPESLHHANTFVRWIHEQEVEAVVHGYDWSANSLANNETLVDIGGHFGTVLAAIAKQHPTVNCVSLDLPEVIASAPRSPPGVELVGGNVMDPSTIPTCDTILLKHFLDRCMWTEEETVQVLRSCHAALRNDAGGRVIIAEAVLPNIGDYGASKTSDVKNNNHSISIPTTTAATTLSMDALYMLVGREGQRTAAEWDQLASRAGFRIERITPTSVPSCYLLVLEQQKEEE